MTTCDNEWCNEWYNEWYKEWYNEWQLVTTTDNEWLFHFLFFFREESTNRHPKENPLNLEEDLEEDLLN